MNRKRNTHHFDGYFLVSVLLLLGMGIVIIYSSSGAYAQVKNLPDTFFLFHHLKKVVIALILFGIGMFVDFRIWKKVKILISAIVIIFLNIQMWHNYEKNVKLSKDPNDKKAYRLYELTKSISEKRKK